MKVFVDPGKCIGCTQCASICPEVYAMDGSLAYAIEGAVPEVYIPSALDAEQACPVYAISHAM